MLRHARGMVANGCRLGISSRRGILDASVAEAPVVDGRVGGQRELVSWTRMADVLHSPGFLYLSWCNLANPPFSSGVASWYRRGNRRGEGSYSRTEHE